MDRFADVFYLPDVDSTNPYRCFVWSQGRIVDLSRLPTLHLTIQWCRKWQLPVRVYDRQLCEDLREQGIDVRLSQQTPPPNARAVGE